MPRNGRSREARNDSWLTAHRGKQQYGDYSSIIPAALAGFAWLCTVYAKAHNPCRRGQGDRRVNSQRLRLTVGMSVQRSGKAGAILAASHRTERPRSVHPSCLRGVRRNHLGSCRCRPEGIQHRSEGTGQPVSLIMLLQNVHIGQPAHALSMSNYLPKSLAWPRKSTFLRDALQSGFATMGTGASCKIACSLPASPLALLPPAWVHPCTWPCGVPKHLRGQKLRRQCTIHSHPMTTRYCPGAGGLPAGGTRAGVT